MIRFYTLLLLVLLIATSAVLWATSSGFLQVEERSPRLVSSTGKAQIGGAFTLTSSDNKTVTDADFRGKYMLVFFGFTHCPDQCPVSLKTMTDALNLMGKKADAIVPIFITVDPERDTPQRLAEYAQSFHPKLVSLTGSMEAIRQATDAYKAVYSRAEKKAEQAPDAYNMNHSSIIYFMDKQGEYITHFRYDITPEELARALEQQVEP